MDLGNTLIKPPEYQKHWNESLSEDSYHLIKDFVGSSSLRKLMKSPKTFYHNHFVAQKEPSKEMKFGTVAHGVIFYGKDYLKNFHIMPEFMGRTLDGKVSSRSKESQMMKQDWVNSLPIGSKIITKDEMDCLNGIVESLLGHTKAFNLLKNGKPEMAGFWRDEKTGIGLKLKPDFQAFDVNALVDLKTARDCTEEVFMRSVFKDEYRYDIQLAMYAEGIKQLTGKYPEHRAWIVMEKEPPYEIAVHESDEICSVIGAYEFHRLLDKLKESIDSAKWPGYQTMIETAIPPEYIINKYQMMGVL